ncbi:MAG: Gfo/Idh/MocA family oxidoreductase [Lachnospiraceae bacterium]|nr:Gfo/Idh/MocA family oxidoreductase [Lachnospiraceae bacterium]
MEKIRLGIIGMGNMGCKYAALIMADKIPDIVLTAVTRVRSDRLSEFSHLPIYPSADALFSAVEDKSLSLDAVLIATPHYVHQEQMQKAMQLGLHVLCDKPAGVYSRQGRKMREEAAKHSDKVYAMVFNQRTNPLYRRMKEIVDGKQYGSLKRVNWVVTDWYRPNAYYNLSAWRATWEKDGGGTLLNQCPHNLDLLQWICGMPVSVQGFCHEGKYHPIEVEDEVTAYLEFKNGATGVFIASTGEAPGINRLEISLEDALLVCEKGELKVCELGFHEAEYRQTATDSFRKLEGKWLTLAKEGENTQYVDVLRNFAEAVIKRSPLIVDGREGCKSLLLSNAIYLSSWQKCMVMIPEEDSADELLFEQNFEAELRKKGGRFSPIL